MKTTKLVSLSEDIRSLICRGNKNKANGALEDTMTYEVTVILNVLSMLIEDIIMSNLYSATIITMEWCRKLL